ncbi:unnamed protein product [Cuscuta europaea]|uniref:Uncharacterized protein n=1 Tax=Cuscuta europaea TaxID=41803 RepID=A0A9P0ZMB2_CUSEU|nr:unnamed protein product [Cuscuta europaea]CAH9103902.1 unnamed protein product [Cuscuta europaea]
MEMGNFRRFSACLDICIKLDVFGIVSLCRAERKTIPLVPGLHSEERNARILSFPIEDRTYVNLVSDFQGTLPLPVESDYVGLRRSRRHTPTAHNLNQNSHVVFVEDSGQGSEVSKDDGEGMSAFVPLQVVFPIAKNTPVPPLKDSTPIAATSSSTSRSVPSDHELLAMASRRKRMPSKLSANPPKVPKYPTPDAATTPNAPNAEHGVDTWAKPPQVMHLSLSPEFCDLKDALIMKDEMAQFQLASSAPFFDCLLHTGVIAASSAYAFKSIQASLVAAARVSLLERTVDELKQKEISLASTLDKSTKLVQELEDKSSTQSAQILQLNARVKSLEAYGRKKKQEVIDAACYYVWKTRGELMTSFIKGEMTH